jgi:hypothetical protein
MAVADAAHERACGKALAARRQWSSSSSGPSNRATLREARSPRSAADAAPRCSSSLAAASRGALLELSGRAEAGERAVVVREGRCAPLGAGALLPRLRARTGARIDRHLLPGRTARPVRS